ncbi:MAG: CheY-like chemotaxis protein [Zhongshania sp.]|jgi:CheY-like chemotaxis protein
MNDSNEHRVVPDSDVLNLAEEPAEGLITANAKPWKLLIVDDEQVVHTVTNLALDGFNLGGRGLEFLSAYSAAEARQVLHANPDIAVILLDVVMETDRAGLDLVHYIRRDLNNRMVRIVLRTGQSGQSPEQEVITQYDINDYKEKTELTRQKLFSTVYSSLRSYGDIFALEENRKGLMKVISASATIFETRDISQFFEGVLEQLTALLYLNSDAVLINASALVAHPEVERLQIMAGTGKFKNYTGDVNLDSFDATVVERIRYVLKCKKSNYGDNYWVSYYITKSGLEQLLYVSAKDMFSVPDIQMIELFVKNVAIAHETIALLEGRA